MRVDRELHTRTIEMYLQVRQTIFEVASLDTKGMTFGEFDVDPTKADLKASSEANREMWGWFRTARVFEFAPESLHKLSNKILTEVAEYLPESARFYDTTKEDEAIREFGDEMSRRAAQQNLPEDRPFPSIYIGYGYGNDTKAQTIPPTYRKHLEGRARAFSIVGHLICGHGAVYSMLAVVGTSGNIGILPIRERSSDSKEGINGWVNLPSLTAWTIPWLLNYIDNHSAVVTECRGMRLRRDFESAAKKARMKKPVPPPYYLLPMKSTYLDERRVTKVMPRSIEFERRHRFDRRGHNRHLVRRGPLPLDPKEKSALVKRGYKVWERGNIDPEVEVALSVKGHVRKDPAAEWMAVKTIRIKEQEAIPYDRTDLPHITAARQGTNPVLTP